jgi:hypothetical protein
VGLAVPHRPGAFLTVLPRAPEAAQDADRLGPPDGPAGSPSAPECELVLTSEMGFVALELFAALLR